jgi:hypothetical protein
VVGILVMVQDITAQKIKAALWDVAQRLQLATEVTGTGGWHLQTQW